MKSLRVVRVYIHRAENYHVLRTGEVYEGAEISVRHFLFQRAHETGRVRRQKVRKGVHRHFFIGIVLESRADESVINDGGVFGIGRALRRERNAQDQRSA